MYPDYLPNWLDGGHGLLVFLIFITGINPEGFKWGVDHSDHLLCPGL